MSDYASAWTTSICADGQTPTTASIPFAQGLTSSMPVGIGMTPVNVLDITQTQNNTSIVKILNASAGAAAQAFFQVSNGTHIGYFYINGPSFTPSGIDLADGVVLKSTGAGGLTLSGSPIYGVGLLDISNASSGQIKFPSTQNPSSDVNTLDDYEEGTFTPGVTFGGASVGMTFSQQVGTYIKIGRLVFISAAFTFTAKGSSTGTFLLTGLPFASLNGNAFGGVSIWSYLNLNSITSIFGNVTRNDTTIGLSNFGAANSTALDNTAFNNSSSIVLSATYYAAS